MRPKSNRLQSLFVAAPVLTVTAAVMLFDLLLCAVGLVSDRTVITGLPVWIKPAKFAASTGIYAISLAVIIQHTPVWKRVLRAVEALIASALTLEVVLIDVQAARHTTSHFNIATPFDAAVWTAMAISIGIFWLASIVVMLAAFRSAYASPAWTIAVRCGMLLAVAGTGSGIFMTFPSAAQMETARTTQHMTIVGSHTIGGADGGTGLPVLGWSTRHGDVRVAHFVGLHGLQAFALAAFLLQRRRVPHRRAARIVSVVVFSYVCAFGIILAEALGGNPVTDHDAGIASVWALWALLSFALAWIAMHDRAESALSIS